MLNIKEELINEFGLSEADFASHETDLYVRYTPEIKKWIDENYDFPCNVQSFTSQIDGKRWLDIPFALFNTKMAKYF